MERIRILRVIARLNVGGPARHVLLLTGGLDAGRYVTTLVVGQEAPGEGHMQRLAGPAGVAPEILPELGREISIWRDLKVLARLYRICRRDHPHIVHTHTAKAGVLGRLAARLAGVPVIVHTYHGHVLQQYFSPAKTRVFLLIERRLSRFTDRLVAVSDAVRQDLLALGIGTPERFSVVPLGLDLEPFLNCDRLRGQLRAELGLAPEAPLVGLVARLVPIKRHEDFLHAAALLARRLPETRMVLVGDGERRAELGRLARRLGLADRVIFLGWRADLDRIYADLDLVVLTSANEGSPVALIEAMAAGRAVVATRVGGVADLVEDGVAGLLAPPRDPTALAAAIAALLGDPERRRAMGQAGRKRVYPAFTADRLLHDLDRLYVELIAGKRTRTA